MKNVTKNITELFNYRMSVMAKPTMKITDANVAKIVEVVRNVVNLYPTSTEFRADTVADIARDMGYSHNFGRQIAVAHPKLENGRYDLSAAVSIFEKDDIYVAPAVQNVVSMVIPAAPVVTAPTAAKKVASVVSTDTFIPDVLDTYVAWGHFSDVTKIIKSKMFYPMFTSGLSGNGKTLMVEQACAKLRLPCVRVQISPETDEDDLLGGLRLIGGETIFQKGPVIQAMETGSLLLLDEIDRGTNKIMCLQAVLEGKPILIKKTGEIIRPAKGFNVIATANTKGKGSEDGRFAAATIIDEAFLERFAITLEQPYPSAAIEKRIVMKHMMLYSGEVDEEFADHLTNWAKTIRDTFAMDAIDEIISTRRLCHIVQTHAIFKDKMKSIQLCVNRFDDETKEAFVDLYTKVDAGINLEDEDVFETPTETFV
jgi:MoxR-like ATPase